MTGPDPDLTDRQRDILEALPASTPELSDKFGIADTTIEGHRNRLNDKPGIDLVLEREGDEYIWHNRGDFTLGKDDSEDPDPADIEDVTVPEDTDPSYTDASETERYLLEQLRTGATLEDLAEDLDERDTLVSQRLRDLKLSGWRVHVDPSSEHYTIRDEDAELRSSEHKATRSRKANKWWQLTNDQLQLAYKGLDPVPEAAHRTDEAQGDEDWVYHLTDLHIGDKVRRSDGVEVYNTEIAMGKALYTARKAVELAKRHTVTGGTCWFLIGGDSITGECIYEGQHENLSDWLDTQLDAAVETFTRIVRLLAEHFSTVNIQAQTGNHGEIRANGSSKQMNGDLLAYRNLRNRIAALQTYDAGLDNVRMSIGQPGRYLTWDMRDGNIRGHLRHGDAGRDQSQTAAGKRDFGGWLIQHKFDMMWMGHFHSSKQDEIYDRPIFYSGSPKPPGEYAEKLGVAGDVVEADHHRKIAHAMGVDDDGPTALFPIDTRDFGPEFIPDYDPGENPLPEAEGLLGTNADHSRKGWDGPSIMEHT